MTREGALLVIIAVTLALVALGVWGWRRRGRRNAVRLIQPSELAPDAAVLGAFDGLYVATTAHDAPLERINAPGLGFRSRVGVTVTPAGVALDLTGQPRIVLTPDRIVDVAQSTVAIDRVVEKDGLTRLSWRTDAGDVVDTYLRPQQASARSLADAVRAILPQTPTGAPQPQTGPHTAPTGTDA